MKKPTSVFNGFGIRIVSESEVMQNKICRIGWVPLLMQEQAKKYCKVYYDNHEWQAPINWQLRRNIGKNIKSFISFMIINRP